MMIETKPDGKFIEQESARSKVAVLGLLAKLRRDASQYDLKLLRRLVKNIQPDLLCAEFHPDNWQSGDLSALWPEYRETLLPLARRTDIIIVPVGGSVGGEIQLSEADSLPALRQLFIQLINRSQIVCMQLARHPDDVNNGVLGAFCDWMCALALWASGPQARQAWDEANQAILNNIMAAVRRDLGRRVLVTVDCRRRRWLVEHLRGQSEIELLTYHAL